METISTKKIMKIGVVVEDIEKSAKAYAELFGLEEPVIKVPDLSVPSTPDGPHTIYKGEYRTTGCKTAVIPVEPIYIELIEPLNHPSPWTEFQEKHQQGVHYLAFNIDGFAEHAAFMESKDMPVVQKTEKGHERYAYFDTEKTLGVTIEFKETGEKVGGVRND
ncbi:VOC family protein [Gracilibacillus sp. YIM 98692]|uniref:VOC family protein n=1 Tax=Gracilibacillus sp. YIM 98692 TaxID=2663532 RepID=UPI0013D7E79E|nr:VOC family protein [Gracilibacillus sp. YIM 98692]